MQIILLILLILLAVGVMASGILSALFPVGIGIALLVNTKDADKAMDRFFAFCFFAAIVAIAYEIFR